MELTEEKLRQVIKQVIAEECDPNRVQVSVSNHHIHLTEADFKTLFPNGKMEAFKPLKQPGEYATANVATIVGPAGKIEHVRVLGPCRSHSQVEIARSEAIAIGVDAPIRLSGHLDGTPSVKLVTPDGQVDVQGVIVAKRHIHMSDDDAKRLALSLAIRSVLRSCQTIVGQRLTTLLPVLVRTLFLKCTSILTRPMRLTLVWGAQHMAGSSFRIRNNLNS